VFHGLYYPLNPYDTFHHVQGINVQNIWAMNFANALLLYGMVYFFFRSIKPDTVIIKPVFWGIYYNLSVLGFFNFMAVGFLNGWTWSMLFHDLIFAVISGAISGALIFKIYRWFNKK
jgi:hypothetical protein